MLIIATAAGVLRCDPGQDAAGPGADSELRTACRRAGERCPRALGQTQH